MKTLAAFTILAALATPAAAQPQVSSAPSVLYGQQQSWGAAPPITGTTTPLGNGFSTTRWQDIYGQQQMTCTTTPLGNGFSTTRCQ